MKTFIKNMSVSCFFKKKTSLVLLLLSFLVSVPVVFGAALCVTNPERGTCLIFVDVRPESFLVPSGGNTNVVFAISGILQYDVQVMEFDTWMVEAGTGRIIDITPSGAWPSYGGNPTGNTGPLTGSVMVHSYVMNTQGVADVDSSLITVAVPAPTVNINFSFFDKVKTSFEKFL